MALSRTQSLKPLEKQWFILITFILLIYLSFLAFSLLLRKWEFAPFEAMREHFLQLNPFETKLPPAPQPTLTGKGVAIRLNTLCNSLITSSPEFHSLYLSRNILGERCATDPSEVGFVVYILYAKSQVATPKADKKVIYRLQKKVAVVNWRTKELVAQKTFSKEYHFVINGEGRHLEADRKLCRLSEEPGDLEVKQWLATLASKETAVALP